MTCQFWTSVGHEQTLTDATIFQQNLAWLAEILFLSLIQGFILTNLKYVLDYKPAKKGLFQTLECSLDSEHMICYLPVFACR